MKRRHMVLAAGLLLSAWLALFGDKQPDGAVSEPVERRVAPPAQPATRANQGETVKPRRESGGAGSEILALRPRDSLIGGAQIEKPAEGLFGSQSWTPPPPPAPPPPPPPPPSAPPLPFTYLGKKVEDGVWEVYLSRGDQTVIAKENDTIDGTYHVATIKPPTMTLMYMPLKEIQTITIGGTE
jgi:hypothetical protein